MAAARGDAEAVLRALAPVPEIEPSAAVDEPGFWPWQHLYADALVSTGRLDDAERFLARHEPLAAARAHGTTMRAARASSAAAWRPRAAIATAPQPRSSEAVEHVEPPSGRTTARSSSSRTASSCAAKGGADPPRTC